MISAGRPPPLRLAWVRAMGRLRDLIGLPSEAESIKRNLEALLSTTPGERRMRPEYGCDIQPLLFEPVGPVMLEEMRRRVGAAILCWEPRIDLIDVRAEAGDPDSRALLIEVDYGVRSTGERSVLVLPLYA